MNWYSGKTFMWILAIFFAALYPVAYSNDVLRNGKFGPLLASLKAAERAADAMASQSQPATKLVPIHSAINLNLEDILKETKLRKILQLIKENNKENSQDVNEKYKGPRIFIVKKNVADDEEKSLQYELESNAEVMRRYNNDNFALRHPRRRNPGPDMKTSSEFDERHKKMDYGMRQYNAPRKTTRGKDGSYVDEDDEEMSKMKGYQNPIDAFTPRDWDPSPVRPAYPKYTDGPLDENDNEPRQRDRGVPYRSKKRWDGEMLRNNNMRADRDERLESEKRVVGRGPNKPYMDYGYNRHRGRNQLLGRTQIPYSGNRNIYEK